MEIRLLGPLEVIRDGEPVALGGPKVRAVLAMLALSPNRTVADRQLVDAVWGDHPPANATKVLQNCVLRARKAVGTDLIARRPAGYELVAEPAEIDLCRVEQLFEKGRAALQDGTYAAAVTLLEAGLREWRGVALEELAELPLALTQTERIAELRLAIVERLIDARLALGQHSELLTELARLTAEEPLRERFWMQRMLALYRAGRQPEALRAYQELRELLDEQLGLRPSPETVELERAILRQSPDLAVQPAGLPSGLVTFLMTDIEGSTKLLHELGEQYEATLEVHHAALRRALGAHQGREVTTTGDGFLAVFADPTDATAAALTGQRLLGECAWPVARGVRVRMGLHTGPAAPTAEGDYISIAVNEVARVCDAGHGGQILASADFAGALGSRLPAGCELVSLGKYRLKGFSEPVGLHELLPSQRRERFPELRAAPAGHNLPPERTEFIGRTRELAELASLVGAHGLVTIIGPGGVGKTRMLLEAGARTRLEYPDGVWLITLGSVQDPELIPAVMASVLGVREPSQTPVFDAVLGRLEDAKLLLLMDNCEHLVDAVAGIVDHILAACPRVKVLASSREPLAIPPEAVYQLTPLPLPDGLASGGPGAVLEADAARLFVDRATRARADFELDERNAAEVAEICRLLDGLPLALELAAPLVRQMPVAELAKRVRRQLLMPVAGRGRDARHATVRAAIEWSYRMLDTAQQALFMRLGVFAGGFTLGAAEDVSAETALGTDDVMGLLAALVEKSLVMLDQRGGGSRYRMLGTIRQFALECLTEEIDADAVRRAHLAFYHGLADQIDPDLTGLEQARLLDQLDLEQDNFRAALAWAEVARGEQDAFARLATSLIPLWRIRAQLSEGRRWLASAAARAQTDRLCAAAGLGEGTFALAQGDYKHAGLVLEQTLVDYERLGDSHGVACSLHALGQLHAYRGDHHAATARFEAAVTSFSAVGDAAGLALVHHEIGRFARFRGDYATATEHLGESLRICRELGDARGTAEALHELGRAARRQGEAGVAAEHLESALRLYSELGDRRGIAKSNYALGALALEVEDRTQARDRFTKAVASFREVGDPQGMAWPLRGLAAIATIEGDLDVAHERFQEVLATGRAMDSLPVIMSALWGLGDLAEARGDIDRAMELLREALEVGSKAGYGPDVAAIRARIASLTQP